MTTEFDITAFIIQAALWLFPVCDDPAHPTRYGKPCICQECAGCIPDVCGSCNFAVTSCDAFPEGEQWE